MSYYCLIKTLLKFAINCRSIHMGSWNARVHEHCSWKFITSQTINCLVILTVWYLIHPWYSLLAYHNKIYHANYSLLYTVHECSWMFMKVHEHPQMSKFIIYANVINVCDKGQVMYPNMGCNIKLIKYDQYKITFIKCSWKFIKNHIMIADSDIMMSIIYEKYIITFNDNNLK